MGVESQVERLRDRLEDLYAEMSYLEEEIADVEAQLAELGYEEDGRVVEFTPDMDEDYPFDPEDIHDDDDDEGRY